MVLKMAREEKRVGFQGDCFVKLKDRFCSISQSISFIFMYMRRDVLGIDHDHDHDDALVVPQGRMSPRGAMEMVDEEEGQAKIDCVE